MNTEKRKYSVDIFGQEYVLISDEAESLIIKAAALVDATMREIQKAGLSDKNKLAILAALRIASLLESERLSNVASKVKEQELLSRIDQELLSFLQ
jgi:cell division protein ZapA (FtsZ GTPase activity inhibitor)